MKVPYVTTWSTERPSPARVVTHPRFGIAYADETMGDRDGNGVLWPRMPSRPGHGRPEFGKVHPLRQRRAMRRLLCQVCAGPADRTGLGVLWMLRDFRADWPGWPERMAAIEPPVCLPCAHTSIRACPSLREGYVTVRVRESTVSGVYGVRYQPGTLAPVEDATLAFDDPDIRWVRAAQLVRELRGCAIVDLVADQGELSSSASGLGPGRPGSGPSGRTGCG